MKLEKNYKKRIIGISIILVLFITIVIIYHGFIFYKEIPNHDYNTYLSVIVNGEEKNEFPSKESGLKVKEIICNNETEIYWDYEIWGPVIKKLSKNNTKCRFTFASEYSEGILNGTDPVLKEGLIPVTISDDGTVKRAKLSEEWYSYANQRWANAVILEDESKKYYEGEIIPEDNIESYFVWIPKYKYKLWNVASTETSTNKGRHSIEIEFGTENTTNINEESCATPMTSGATEECNNGEYMTHPAFISLGVNGIWVGKFVTGYKESTSISGAEVNINDSSRIIIKPSVYSWRGLTVGNMFMNSYNYRRNLGSHMMKNTEWGAVAYFSHSKYGINKEANVNNNSAFLTGYSATSLADQSVCPGVAGTDSSLTLPYNTPTGYLASTTGNITGVYDMSGGPYEYVAAYLDGNIGSSEFSDVTNPIYAKYIDTYNSSIATFQYRILGDAIGEMGPFSQYRDGNGHNNYHNSWYADVSAFVYSAYPWGLRAGGYNNGVAAGPFSSSRFSGDANSGFSYRVVLAF